MYLYFAHIEYFECEPMDLNISINQHAQLSCSLYNNFTYIHAAWMICPESGTIACIESETVDESGCRTNAKRKVVNDHESTLDIFIDTDSCLLDKLHNSLIRCELFTNNGLLYNSSHARLLVQGQLCITRMSMRDCDKVH